MITKVSPLNGISIGAPGKVTLREIAGANTIDLRVKADSEALAAVTKEIGVELVGNTGKSVKSEKSGKLEKEEGYALCLGPDWWLLVGMPGAEQQLAALRSNSDHHFSFVNVTGQRTTIEIEGPHARDLLAHLWEQDLRDKSFPVGTVSQGLMAKAPVILIHIAPSRYRIMVRSSFALHLWKALVDAGEELMEGA